MAGRRRESLRRARTRAAASVLLLTWGLSACVPEPSAAPAPSAGGISPTSWPTATRTPSPTIAPASIPEDCRTILSAGVLDQLDGVALNDPTFGASGAQADGSLICLWGDPAGDAYLTTTLTYVSRGPALDMLNGLLSDGFACYTPDDGTRCEKTWFSEPDLLPQGRTLFWREDILIDTQYTDLAPSGYTDAIVARVFG